MEDMGEMLRPEPDDLILIPITTARDMYGVDAFKRLSPRLPGRERRPSIWPRTRSPRSSAAVTGSPKVMKDDFQVLLQEEMLGDYGVDPRHDYQRRRGVVSIALLVGGIGIMNIMLVSVTERTREIGVRKAVGARKSDILVQFLIEAVTISLFGGLIGVLGGWGLGILGAKAIPGFPPAHVPLWAIALGFGFAALVGIFFGTYPAAKAAALDPIDALRHE